MSGPPPANMAGPPSPKAFFAMTKKPYLIATVTSMVLVNVLLLANLSWLYGSIFQSETKVSALKVLFVDSDGGLVGQSLRGAYDALKADTFVSFHEAAAGDYADAAAVTDAVCRGDYWGAMYVNSGASSSLASALEGSAPSYDASAAVTTIWSEIRYPAASQAYISAGLSEIVGAASTIYYGLNGTQALTTLDTTNPTSLSAFFHPIAATDLNLHPAATGARVLWNTGTIPMHILSAFFFILASNGMSGPMGFNYFARVPATTFVPLRMGISAVYTLITSLTTTGYIWAFRAAWAPTSAMFGQTWMVLWLAMHANYLLVEVGAAVVPMKFTPFWIFTWVILNVSSTIFPFELSAGFFRIGYAWLWHNLYEVLITIWSEGCVNRLYRNLPVLFVYWIVFGVLNVWVQFRRCRLAREAAAAAASAVPGPKGAAPGPQGTNSPKEKSAVSSESAST